MDADKDGKDSDHDVALFAPLSSLNFKIVETRPIPDSQVVKFKRDLASHPWS